jgi:hypothetical protein
MCTYSHNNIPNKCSLILTASTHICISKNIRNHYRSVKETFEAKHQGILQCSMASKQRWLSQSAGSRHVTVAC